MDELLDHTLDEIFEDEKLEEVGSTPRWRGRRGRPRSNGKRKSQESDRSNRSRKRRDTGVGTRGNISRDRYVYITSRSEVKRVAGKVAHDLRDSHSPTLVCTGKLAINQAVKTLAIARSYLADDNLDFKIYPEFQLDKERHDSIYLVVTPVNGRVTLSTDNAVMLTSSEKAKAGKIGGKIAHTIRDGKRVLGQGVGPNAVWRFVQSLLIAKDFLKENNLDLSFRAQFVVEHHDEQEVNAIQFYVYAEQI